MEDSEDICSDQSMEDGGEYLCTLVMNGSRRGEAGWTGLVREMAQVHALLVGK